MSIVIIILALFLYLLPSLVAVSNKKSNAGAIAALNILLGWSFLGWVVALIWSLSKDKPADIIRVFEDNHPHTMGYVRSKK